MFLAISLVRAVWRRKKGCSFKLGILWGEEANKASLDKFRSDREYLRTWFSSIKEESTNIFGGVSCLFFQAKQEQTLFKRSAAGFDKV